MLCAVLALASPRVFAVTTTVLPGQSIQAAIDAATAGDMLIIKGGTYGESITIDKNVDFRREAGTTVHVTGNVTLSGITGAFTFANFRFGSAATNLTINNCDNVILEDVNGSTNGGLVATNSKVYAYDCTFGANVTFTSSDWTLQECQVSGNLTSNSSDTRVLRTTITGNLSHNTTGDTNCTVFQSTIGERLLTKAKRSWIGYNTIRYVDLAGGALEAEIVGNDVNLRDGNNRTIEIDAVNVSVKILNNRLRNSWSGSYEGGTYHSTYAKDGIRIWNCKKALVANNEFNRLHGTGVYIKSAFGGSATVTGNFFFHVQKNIINAPDAGVAFFNNYWEERNNQTDGWVSGGVVKGAGNVKGDSGLPLANYVFDWSTIPDSLKDKGPDGLEFKDHNGTRNDIGPFGGHHYDPNGATASTPVVLSADLAPMRIQKGVTTIVKVRSRAAVSTPKQ